MKKKKSKNQEIEMCDISLPIRKQIKNMQIGASIAFPLDRLSSVRSIASNVGLERGVRMRTYSMPDERLVVVSCGG